MNRLKRVRVSGFKSIREMDLELGSINAVSYTHLTLPPTHSV